MKIITLTLNPAIDVHCAVDSFRAEHENFAAVTKREAGGKGVNISRALTVNGIENDAIIVLGNDNGEDFCRELLSVGMIFTSIWVNGRIRENITVHTANSTETRLSFEGFSGDKSLLDRIEEAICERVTTGDIVTFTGSVPSGIDMKDVITFLKELSKKGILLVIDSRSFSKEELVECKPWLIKPNEEEISKYFCRDIKSFEEVLDGAKELCRDGIQNVMITLGEKGALLVCAEGNFVVTPPHVTAISTIGAGDSTIAGFIASAKAGSNSLEMLKNAVAYGTAACMTEGTQPPNPQDVKDIYDKCVFHTFS